MSALTVGVAIATPLLAFLGVLAGQFVARRGDKEADQWRRREETMRLLRWAVESAASENPVMSEAGLALLAELADAEILQPEDRALVEAVAEVVRRTTGAMAYAELSDRDYADLQKSIEVEEGGDG